ncbi:twin-arginine translocase subunit TatC [candidate division WOR-3 bacterium]|nr:twin-arginine translocase subunit TatC [candidate division WOR-3 bacterium]
MPEKKISFLDHLEELRRRILYALGCVLLFSIGGYVISRPALKFILQSARIPSAYFFSPTEAFFAQIKVAVFLGIIASFPFLLLQVWLFITPALTRSERGLTIAYLGTGIFLFAVGIGFGYFILIPFGLRFLLSFGTDFLQPLMNVSKYLSFMSWCLLGSGFLFQLPLLLFFLIQLGILDLDTVIKHRAEAIVVLLVLCAVITPSGDFFTLMLIAVPMILLFELSILAARIANRKRQALQR